MWLELGKCRKCGGTVVNDSSSTGKHPKVESARCIKCGKIYYKGFPERMGGKELLCNICGKIFKAKKEDKKHPHERESSTCPKCKKDIIVRCVVCGRPIHKGMVCTKKACKSKVGNKVDTLDINKQQQL